MSDQQMSLNLPGKGQNTDRDATTQLALVLPHRPALGAQDFLISACNEAAVGLIDLWPDWSSHAQLVVGPPRSGKSHLANVWRMRSNAHSLLATDLGQDDVAALGKGKGVVIEDADWGRIDEQALFHLLNLSKEKKFNILLTARTLPGDWRINLPDLRSRSRALPVISIEAPDDLLLRGVLVKLFADRQLEVDPAIIEYIFNHMERSFEAVHALVASLDRAALKRGGPVTRKLVASILEPGG